MGQTRAEGSGVFWVGIAVGDDVEVGVEVAVGAGTSVTTSCPQCGLCSAAGPSQACACGGRGSQECPGQELYAPASVLKDSPISNIAKKIPTKVEVFILTTFLVSDFDARHYTANTPLCQTL